MAYETPLTINEVVKDISNNKYVLPSIQREYVWKTLQIERLFDSLMQNYPIGTFLFWEVSNQNCKNYDFYYFLKDYHERTSTHNPKANLNGTENITAVLDGQQRLTSLYIGLKGSYAYKIPYKQWKSENAFPKRKLYINLVMPSEDSELEYDFRFLTNDELKNDNNHYWFEVGEILNMSALNDVTGYIIREIMFKTYSQKQCEFAIKSLSQLFNVIHTIPVISYYKEKTEQLDKVLNIFIRVNSGGTTLSYSDLLLSIASAQWQNLDAREEITEFVENINSIGSGFNVNKDFVLKAALALSDFKNIAYKVDNFNKENMLKIESNWNRIKKSIYQAVSLIASFGYSRETLKSNNAIIPIAYYLMTINAPDSFETSTYTATNRAKMKKWLILSLLKKAFSGTSDNVIRQIRDIIKNNKNTDFPLEDIIEKFKGTNKSIIFTHDDIDEYLLKQKYGSGESLSVLMLLYPSFDFSNKFHVDHIYPKSKFTSRRLVDKGIPQNQIYEYISMVNDISNLQLLPAIPNMEKQDKDFAIWFSEICDSDVEKERYKKLHYMPDMDYSYSNFLAFINGRRNLLKNELEKILL